MKTTCRYCLREIDARGLNAHVHFRHRDYVSREFWLNPTVWIFMWATAHDENGLWRRYEDEERYPPRLPLALPAPSPLTVYPHIAGLMAAPTAKMPRWIC